MSTIERSNEQMPFAQLPFSRYSEANPSFNEELLKHLLSRLKRDEQGDHLSSSTPPLDLKTVQMIKDAFRMKTIRFFRETLKLCYSHQQISQWVCAAPFEIEEKSDSPHLTIRQCIKIPPRFSYTVSGIVTRHIPLPETFHLSCEEVSQP